MVTSFALFDIIAVVALVLVMTVPLFLIRRIDHGEARFDSKTGKQIGDE